MQEGGEPSMGVKATARWVQEIKRSRLGDVGGLGVSLPDRIGNTPLLRLRSLPVPAGVVLLGKAEGFNPGGSCKDRVALSIIREGERSGALTSRKVLLDSSSGNTAAAYAMLGAHLGYRVELVMPADVSPQKLALVRAYGAKVRLTDPQEGSDGAVREARRLYEENPEKYFYANQYDNPAAWRAHYETTGPEILEQTRGEITHFVAGVGTGGTITGVGRCLKAFNPDIRVVGVEPRDRIEGLRNMRASAIKPRIYDPSVVDQTIYVDRETARRMAEYVAKVEGLYVGLSAGAVIYTACWLTKQISRGVIMGLLADMGHKYLNVKCFVT